MDSFGTMGRLVMISVCSIISNLQTLSSQQATLTPPGHEVPLWVRLSRA